MNYKIQLRMETRNGFKRQQPDQGAEHALPLTQMGLQDNSFLFLSNTLILTVEAVQISRSTYL